MQDLIYYKLLNFKVLMMMSVAKLYPFYLKINDLLIKVEHCVNNTVVMHKVVILIFNYY